MKQLVIILFAVFFAGACTQKSGYTISGTATNANGTELFLEKITQKKQEIIDTVSIAADGNFKMEGSLQQEGIFRLANARKQGIILHLKPGSTITIDMDFDDLSNIAITGSEESNRFKAFNTFYSDRNAKKTELVRKFQAEKDSTIQSDYFVKLQNWDNETADLVKQKIKEEPSALLGILMIGAVPAKGNKKFYNDFNDRLQLEMPNSTYAKDFNDIVSQVNSMITPPTIGDTVPDIVMPNPQGETLKLSDLRGKYVLVDFWAAWCGPCRRENPNVVKAYKEYHDKGFEVFNVSLDKTAQAWQRAIEQDNLDWPYHVSDLKYWNNAAAKAYGVKSIPASFLIDKDGKVIATNLRGPALEAKLAEIFK